MLVALSQMVRARARAPFLRRYLARPPKSQNASARPPSCSYYWVCERCQSTDNVIDLLEDCKKVRNSTSATKSLVLTTFMKLSHRLSGAELPRIVQVRREL